MNEPKKNSYQESQTIEWKWSWQDDYLKWICGYANTEGGTIYIGVNDDGYVVGLKDSKALLESVPNKIRDKLGILVSIHVYSDRIGTNLRYKNAIPKNIEEKLVNQYACGLLSSKALSKNDKRIKTIVNLEKDNPIYVSDDGLMTYIEIKVPEYPFAISCDGKYYKRSGSTLHELNGLELQNFLLTKAGLSWDSVPLPNARIEELDHTAIETFKKKAISNGRASENDRDIPDEVLLNDLKLIDKNTNSLTRAAMMMFYPDPEQYAIGAYIKIAYFAPAGAYGQNKIDDIIYSDDVHGPLMTQVDKAMDLIYTKYLKALISYDGLQRIETFMWPREAFREVLLNAVNHKAYETGIPIQIRIYDDKIVIWNDGKWPEMIDVSKIYDRHPSLPHNPLLANVFYRSGEIESWGSGFDKIKSECDKAEAPYPVLNVNEKGGVEVECRASEFYLDLLKNGRFGVRESEQNKSHGQINNNQNPKAEASVQRMLEICSKELTDKEKKKMLPIVEYLEEHDEITGQQAVELTGKVLSTVLRYISRLEELDVIEKVGATKLAIYKRKK